MKNQIDILWLISKFIEALLRKQTFQFMDLSKVFLYSQLISNIVPSYIWISVQCLMTTIICVSRCPLPGKKNVVSRIYHPYQLYFLQDIDDLCIKSIHIIYEGRILGKYLKNLLVSLQFLSLYGEWHLLRIALF